MSETINEETESPAEVVVRVDIDAAPDDVWQALTTDDGLASWLGDGSTIGDDVGDEIDVNDVVTGQRKRGVLDEVTPGHRLGYTWWPETKPGDATRVAISLEPTHTGTRVTVVESRPLVPTASAIGPMTRTKAMVHAAAMVPATATVHAAAMARATAMTACAADWAWRAALLTVTMTVSGGLPTRSLNAVRA